MSFSIQGYDNLVKIYNPEENVRKGWKEVGSDFVGRRKDVDLLVQTAESIVADSDATKTIFLSGPYGIGKSYLLSNGTHEIENFCKSTKTAYHIARLVFCEDDSFRPFRYEWSSTVV